MSSLKHQLKGTLREVYARVLYHTGLHALVDRLQPRRMTILFGALRRRAGLQRLPACGHEDP